MTVLAQSLDKPLAILNIGGVASLSYVGGNVTVIAFDTGPGNALINDWVRGHGAGQRDDGGQLAAYGSTNDTVVETCWGRDHFRRPWPKSPDRNDFDLTPAAELTLIDDAAALPMLAFTPKP